MPDGDPLARIRASQDTVDAAQEALRDAVAAARAAGRSWAQVGETLGVSRQAAFKRFGTPVDPRTGGAMSRRTRAEAAALGEEALRHYAGGRLDRLRALMTPEVAAELTERRLADVWASLVAETGDVDTFGAPEVRTPDGTPILDGEDATGILVAVSVLSAEAGEWEGRVAQDGDGRVVGLLICPPGATDRPF